MWAVLFSLWKRKRDTHEAMFDLCTNGSCIRIDTSNAKWWRVSFVSDGIEQFLGAEVPHYVATRLSRAFTAHWSELEGEEFTGFGGYSVKWALTLSETHSTLYVASNSNGRTLFWQDKWAKTITAIEIQPDLAAEWSGQLLKTYQQLHKVTQ